VGITFDTAEFLVRSRFDGGFGRTATLGRQNLFIDKSGLKRLSRGLNLTAAALDGCLERYADTFLKTFTGATDVVAIDFSDYEGAGIVHDMNAPLPPHLEQQFDTVIDGGTLEHVFNFPVALANSMRLVRPGGRLFLFCPGNNLMGHGFYQFSPELIYRALAPEHGFDVETLEAVQFKYISTELGAAGEPLEVIDPAKLRTRTVVATAKPVSLHVRARKLRHLSAPFERVPQQSDYVQAWAGDHAKAADRSFLWRIVDAIEWRVPGALKWAILNRYGRLYRNTLRNRAWFRRTRPAAAK
jgi:SAM-dependent methyltransferase